jgi:hypothetical protein
MIDQKSPMIAISFSNIHSIITRGLEVSIEHGRGFSRGGFPNKTRQEGYLKYVRTLISVLNGHHLTEDEIVFPYFRSRLPDVPYSLLTGNHREMVLFIDRIKRAVDRCEIERQVETCLLDLEAALFQLNRMWHPHIHIETEQLASKADGIISKEEQLELLKMVGEHAQKNSGPPELATPFLLYNLSEGERQIFAQGMPSEIVQTLVPIVWKEKWKSMKPFLLD